tara:strand:- start:704 stop:1108 length:405 start_codon:yes stop_codon:yes gene_type:complete
LWYLGSDGVEYNPHPLRIISALVPIWNGMELFLDTGYVSCMCVLAVKQKEMSMAQSKERQDTCPSECEDQAELARNEGDFERAARWERTGGAICGGHNRAYRHECRMKEDLKKAGVESCGFATDEDFRTKTVNK